MEQRPIDEVIEAAPFDERAALEELERVRQEIARYQALREGVNLEFENFIKSFKKPAKRTPQSEFRTPSSEVRIPNAGIPVASPQAARTELPSTEYRIPRTEPRTPNPEYRIPTTEHRIPTTEHRIPSTENRTPIDFEPPVLPRFEDLRHLPLSPEQYETYPEDGGDDAFAPAEAFDRLPPPLETVPEVMPQPPAEAPSSHGRTWFVVGGVIVILSVGGYVWTLRGPEVNPVVVREPVTAAESAQASAPAPSAPPDTTAAAAPASAAAAPAFELVTTSAAWVRVIADGARVIEREVPAGSRIPITAKQSVQIRTGNAGAVRVSMDGVDQGPLGREGEVINRTFTIPVQVR